MSKKEIKNISDEFPNKKGLLNIYMHVSENSGVGYYRQYLPAIKLREHGLANVMINDFKWGEGDQIDPTDEVLFEIANWADVVVVGRKDVAQFYAQWGGIRDFFKIPIVLDTDDNVHHVRPQNPGYDGYHPGSEAIVWNKYGIAKVFDAITVSTENLKEYHKKDNPRIYHLPNNIDVPWFDSFPSVKKTDGKIRIGFIGSAAHTEGVQKIKEPVTRIMQKYPQVIFCISAMYATFFTDWPEELRKRIEFIPWTPLKEWPKGLKSVGLDIGLAPLADNLFNRGKSNLRWMEYSACKIPVIGSKVEPYLCIKDGEDGLLVKEKDEWFNAIDRLVNDEKLRHQIAENAYKRIGTEFSIDVNINRWNDVYKEVHEKHRDFFGRKKQFIKVAKNKYQEIVGR